MRGTAAAPWVALCLLAGVPAQAADVERGAAMYRLHCRNCHGQGNDATLPGVPDITKPPISLKPDLVLLASIRSGRTTMPGYQGLLRDREILDIVAHMRTLR